MTDEVMEPLTGMEFEKRKFEKRSSKKLSVDCGDNSAALAAPPKTPDKKKKKFFFKPKNKQDKKKVMKSEYITNSIRNPSNHPLPEENLPIEDVHMNHQSESPDVGEEPSHSLIKEPQAAFLVTQLPPPTQTPGPPSNPKKGSSESEEVVTHDLPLLSPSSQDPPPDQDLSKPPTEPNPVLSGNPSPWEPFPNNECQIDPNLILSHSWEKCKDAHTPLTTTTSNSYDSHLNTQGPTVADEFPTVANLPPKSSSHDSIPHSPMDDSQLAYSFSDSNSQPLVSSFPKPRAHSLTTTLHITNAYLISESEFRNFSSFFSTLNPQDGLLYGEQARAFFLRSELPNEELSKIWKLSDIDNDKKLTFSEFCIAMKLVRNRKKGVILPLTLPSSILESVRALTNSGESARTQTESLPDSDPVSHPSDDDDVPLLDMDLAGEHNPELSQNLTEGGQKETGSVGSEPTPAQMEETNVRLSDPPRQESPEERDQGPPDETLTVENLRRDLAEDIEDPIPKLSNSSGPIDYKDEIKSIFTPVPNPIPPPPSKTEMKQRSVLPAQESAAPSPRIDVTPIVQMRSQTLNSATQPNPPRHLDIAEGDEEPMILSLTPRGGTDPKDMAKSKYNRTQKRNDRVSAVVLLDQEESQVSLINRGELQTFELSPQACDGQGGIEEYFFKELDKQQTDDGPEKFRDRAPPLSSPVKTVEPNNNKSKMSKFKFLIGRKKNSDSTTSIEKVENGDSLLRKKKGKKSSKKGKSKHKRASSYDLNTSAKPRLYGSQNDLTSPNKLDNRKIVCATTSDELSSCLSPQRFSSHLSLSPSHKERREVPSQGDNDSFDSVGSSEELPSDGEIQVRMRTHTTGSYDYRYKRSVSSPECIMSTTPIPGPDNENRLTITTDLDERTPVHQPEVLSNSQEREKLQERILVMAARCESLRSVNNDLRSELNQIRLQKNEFKMQLRFRTRNYL